jgi:hypothetical protein
VRIRHVHDAKNPPSRCSADGNPGAIATGTVLDGVLENVDDFELVYAVPTSVRLLGLSVHVETYIHVHTTLALWIVGCQSPNEQKSPGIAAAGPERPCP